MAEHWVYVAHRDDSDVQALMICTAGKMPIYIQSDRMDNGTMDNGTWTYDELQDVLDAVLTMIGSGPLWRGEARGPADALRRAQEDRLKQSPSVN